MPVSAKDKAMIARKRDNRELKPKKKYRITNWREYNNALRNRGSLVVWISEEALRNWKGVPQKTVGRPNTYSDGAIEMVLTIGKVFHQPLRQTQGLAGSIVQLLGIILPVPDFSTLSRRSRTLQIQLPKRIREESMVLIMDSTGLKVYGEGEWKTKKHGVSKHRTWQKLHLAIDMNGEIRATVLTPSNTVDAAVVPDLLDQESASVDEVLGDGSYDQKTVYAECAQKGIKKITIPPRKDAILWQKKRDKGPPPLRDLYVKRIWETSREIWENEVRYHRRSLVENTFHRFRKCFGGMLNSHRTETQATEVRIACAALNRMTHLGMPISVAIA